MPAKPIGRSSAMQVIVYALLHATSQSYHVAANHTLVHNRFNAVL
jgi:hypothetical protein